MTFSKRQASVREYTSVTVEARERRKELLQRASIGEKFATMKLFCNLIVLIDTKGIYMLKFIEPRTHNNLLIVCQLKKKLLWNYVSYSAKSKLSLPPRETLHNLLPHYVVFLGLFSCAISDLRYTLELSIIYSFMNKRN